MAGIKDQHELEEMRKRLYSRGFEGTQLNHTLSDKKVDVARNWNTPYPKEASLVEREPLPPEMASASVAAPASQPIGAPQPFHENIVVSETDVRPPATSPLKRYRKIVLLTSVGILAIGVALASAFVFLGGKRISADNINFNIEGPNTIGSSETMSLQIAITNQNTVAIDDATLIVRYPDGTRSVTEPVKNVYEDRIAIGTLQPGEAKNIPIQVAIFGKENDIKELKATFEYRVTGSDGMFYKEAAPLKFQIISSPITLQVSSIGKVAAGQPVDVILTVKSNTNKELKDVLITASYPNGFSYKESNPKPVYNQNAWKIDSLKPEQSVKITIKGAINGLTEEKFGINFTAGLSDTENQYLVASPLAEARTEFVIERPFLAVDIAIDGDADRSVVLEPSRSSQVSITVKNTLEESVYDAVVEVVPKGNAFTAQSIDTNTGFYDSNKNIIRWDSTNQKDFSQIKPGDSRRLNFTIKPTANVGTAAFDVTVNVYAKRVSESSAQEQLIGTVTANAKYASNASIKATATHMTGPLPPKVGETTKYLITLVAEAGGNNMTNTVIKTSLPTYINWLDDFSGPGTVEYNPVTKEISWRVGDVNTGMRKELAFSLSFQPSVSQVGSIPMLLNRQVLTATDRFTNTALQSEAGGLRTELSNDAGYNEGNGSVVN